MKTLVLGMGSSVLADDGVGLAVVRALEARAAARGPAAAGGVSFVLNEEGGFTLLEDALGHDRLIVVDAILGPEPGRLTRFRLADLGPTVHSSAPHGLNLATVLEFGRGQGLAVPREVVVYAVEIRDANLFGERLSPEVEARLDEIVAVIERELTGP
jgi:hydrogenase maturation protease